MGEGYGGKNRYYLIACGTSNYKNSDDYNELASVKTDITRIIDLFTKNFGYTQVLTNLQLNPKAEDLTKQFTDWLQNEERCETDIVIFYYSGHGDHHKQDKHYLVMEDTDPKKIPQTSLLTENLVRPLNNEGVKISQILYIIDTCYSQSGAGDIAQFALSVIQQYQRVEGANIDVHAIAACRAKQTAKEGVFSNALKELLEDWSANELKSGYIHPQDLAVKINEKIRSKTQSVVYNGVGCETSANFLPILPKTYQIWEEKYNEFIKKLLCILKKQFDESLFFINSFLLSGSFVEEFVGNVFEEFVENELRLRENLKEFAIKPVSKEICPLIACSEWCRHRFLEQSPTLANEIEDWQKEVIQYREGVNLNKIKEVVRQSFNKLKDCIQEADLRIQIQIAPQKDEKNGTGNDTGASLLNMNLWVKSKNSPLGMFARNLLLQTEGSNQSECEGDSHSLLGCLAKKYLLSDLIRKARYSLPPPVNLKIEFFLQLNFYQESLEKIDFKYGKNRKPLGGEYPIFINSFERYFDEDFREIRDKIQEMKKALSSHDNNLDYKFYYFGTEPSPLDLNEIEVSKAIAVWSRCRENPLTEDNDLKISEWKDWPQKIHNLREQKNDMEVTLFWDDLYPKPTPSLLNTNLVE